MTPHKSEVFPFFEEANKDMKIILVTGGAGFIGSNFIKYMLATYPDYKIINFDNLTYAGNLLNLITVEDDPRYVFVKGDIADSGDVKNVFEQFNPGYVINFAAESHVDRSIVNPNIFLRSNVIGTQVILNISREHNVKKIIQISTDEVYGSIPTGIASKEEDKLNPNNPYAASKAAADLLIRVAYQTYQQPVNIIRACNNYGPYQFPEKLIPLMIANVLQNEELPLYGDGKNIREWIHVSDFCKAIDLVLHKGTPGQIYNVGTGDNWENLKLVEHILNKFPHSKSHIQFVLDRQGHDFRYALDSGKIHSELGWKPEIKFEVGLQQTIEWYINHQDWIDDIRSGAYLNYNEKKYTQTVSELS